ncbi:rhomboid-like protein [Mycolicibacterium palauense]|uniref:rhomboid-like protein n=1 Tax=Mycolicibacterium palauense TaxID=2034511 RepID=UPI001FE7ED87|nr:rhomboid-like protein [Mycolicibacterium palauense]
MLRLSALRGVADRAGRFVTGAPLTFGWLGLLLVTTLIQHTLTGRQRSEVLWRQSTNLHHLAGDPLRVLLDSLLWIDGYYWWPYALLFCVFLAPAEHWLGAWRWLTVGLSAHVIATYVGEGFLYWRIQQASASPELFNARDIGVSYFLAGIAGVLTYGIVAPWRWVYLGLASTAVVVPLLTDPGFTPVGHCCALLVGLAWYPLTRRRPAPGWDPVRRLTRRGADRGGSRSPGAVRRAGEGGPRRR